MKINTFNALIALLISVLLAYALYLSSNASLQMHVAAGGLACVFFSLLFAIGIEFSPTRTAVVLRVYFATFALIALMLNVLFALFSQSASAYVVSIGILFLLMLLGGRAIYSAKQ